MKYWDIIPPKKPSKRYDIFDRIRKEMEDIDNKYKPLLPFSKLPYEEQERGCLHKGCSECHGSGRKRVGGSCIHMISCPCPDC